MRINILNELRQPVGSIAVFDLSEPAIRLDDTQVRSLSGTLTLVRTNRGLLATLKASAMVPEHCARCLVPVDCPLPITFEEEFIPVFAANTSKRVPDAGGDDAFRIGPDFIVDLDEPLRQYMLMSEPQKPLCRPDCLGLCPSCGADLNSTSCECLAVDQRWSALAGLGTSTKMKGS